MQYQVHTGSIPNDYDCLWLAIYADGQLSTTAQQIDKQLNGEISQLIKNGDINGKIGQTLCLYQQQRRILLVGCGKKDEITQRQFQQVIQSAINATKNSAAKSIYNALTEIVIAQRSLYWNVRFTIETLVNNLYQFDQFKREKMPAHALQQVIFVINSVEQAQAEQAIAHANAIAIGVKYAKDIANLPPNVCNPAYLAQQAQSLAQRSTLIKTEVLGEQQLAALGMNAYLAVSRGSHNEAQLSIMHYKNAPNPNTKPIVLVGKGLTFDAGGISLKPAAEMDEMKYDMCGAASIYGVMNAIAELQLPLNVIGVLAGCENLPDGNAYRPGDILTTMNGLTVEVLNTDAEGRLVLCDTLTYVERFTPELVIDVATLTGACVVALGQHNSGLVSPNDDLAQQLEQAAQDSADKAWRLPLSEEYKEQLKSNFADLANIGGRWGGASTAAAFLSHFTQNYPWAHLDIAGTAWLQGANKGATGRPVPLLVQFLLNHVKAQS